MEHSMGRPFFDPSAMPKYTGPRAHEARTPFVNCCVNEECEHRDYQRMMLLTMERLAQAHAALLLLQRASAKVWPCKADGSTDCETPECQFGATMANSLDDVEHRLVFTVWELFGALTKACIDLRHEWQSFYDTEQADMGIDQADQALADGETAQGVRDFWVQSSTEVIRQQAVNYEELDYDRWFKPPRRSPDIPHGHGT